MLTPPIEHYLDDSTVVEPTPGGGFALVTSLVRVELSKVLAQQLATSVLGEQYRQAAS